MIRPHILRQALIIGGLTMGSVSDGFIFGQMSGMVAALADPASDIPLTPNQISWIAATINATCIFGFALASVTTDKLGRRRTLTLLSLPIIGVWVMVYFAHDFAVFMISRILVGLVFGGVAIIVIISTGEYASPNMRGIWLNAVNSGGTAIGTMIGHILSFFYHWRTVALLGIIPSAISGLLPFFWVESPVWLAAKGKYKECEASFRSLHGHRADAESELQLLLQVEKKKKANNEEKPIAFEDLKKGIEAMRHKYFWNLAILTSVINVYRVAGGKILFSTLAVTMLQEMTGRSDILLFTLLVDGFLVIGAFLSCFLVMKMNMRTLLFSFGIAANLLLFALSACLYFKPADDYVYFPWINSTLLALYFITVNAGPYPVLETLFGEIFPMGIKCTCAFVFGTFGGTLHFVAIKYSPNMFSLMDYHGAFLFNGIIMALCLIYLWIKLPETKGRTLQEIELYFKYNTFDNTKSLNNRVKQINEQAKVLI